MPHCGTMRTSIVRISVAIAAQLRTVDKLLVPKSMGLLDTTYMGPKLSRDPRYGKSRGTSLLSEALAVYNL